MAMVVTAVFFIFSNMISSFSIFFGSIFSLFGLKGMSALAKPWSDSVDSKIDDE